jgi:hypothetical protein
VLANPNETDMQLSLIGRARWPWWLATALVVVLMAIWWLLSPDDAEQPAPAPVAATVNRVPSADMSSPTPASEPIEAAKPAPALKLEGTIMAGAASFAMVRHTTDSLVLQLHVGDRVDDLVVTAVEPDRVVLAGAAKPVVIEADRTVASPAPPVLSRAVVSPTPASQEEPEPAWAGDPAPFGH